MKKFQVLKNFKILFMKKLVLGLIATVMFGLVGNAQNKFNYSLFELVKNNSLDLSREINEILAKSVPNEQILKIINDKTGLKDNFTPKAYEYFNYDSNQMREKGLSDSIFNTNDLNLIDAFVNNLKVKSFDESLSSFEVGVLKLKLSEKDFAKYNTFANIVKYVEYQNHVYSNAAAKFNWDCALAIGQYTLTTVAVGAACIPEPASPLACPLAIGFAVISYGQMIRACRK
jgi:hypothetical protein